MRTTKPKKSAAKSPAAGPLDALAAALYPNGPPPASHMGAPSAATIPETLTLQRNAPPSIDERRHRKRGLAPTVVGAAIVQWQPAAPDADWTLWGQKTTAELWQAVALSLNKEPGARLAPPDEELHLGEASEAFGGEPFERRLLIAVDAVDLSGPLQPAKGLRPDSLEDPRIRVDLRAFAAWAEALDPPWELPHQFPRASHKEQVSAGGNKPGRGQQYVRETEGASPSSSIVKIYGEETFSVLMQQIGYELERRLERKADGILVRGPAPFELNLGVEREYRFAHPTGNLDTPALPFPFSRQQFLAFCKSAPFFADHVVADYADDDRSFDLKALRTLARISRAAAELAFALVSHEQKIEAKGPEDGSQKTAVRTGRSLKIQENTPVSVAELRGMVRAAMPVEATADDEFHEQLWSMIGKGWISVLDHETLEPHPLPINLEDIEEAVLLPTGLRPLLNAVGLDLTLIHQAADSLPSGPKLKRSAFISKYVKVWPHIERNLRDASENGLASVAKAGHGLWYVDSALQWARERGKLIESERPPALGTVWHPGGR